MNCSSNRLANERNEALVRERRDAIEAAHTSTRQLESNLQSLQRKSSEVEQQRQHLQQVLIDYP